jgi:hypothetical protein
MNNKEIVRNILIEEFSKINNVNYHFRTTNFLIKVNTKRLIPSLVNQCIYFEAGINKQWKFQHRKNGYFWLSNIHIWSKFEKETGLNYAEVQSLVKDVLEEGFNLKGITPLLHQYQQVYLLEEGFKLKGITPVGTTFALALPLEEGFNLKGITPDPQVSLVNDLLKEGFNLKGAIK